MPLLECITVEGFKSLESVERLPLGPINVIIGANGSGKSNFLVADRTGGGDQAQPPGFGVAENVAR